MLSMIDRVIASLARSDSAALSRFDPERDLVGHRCHGVQRRLGDRLASAHRHATPRDRPPTA